MMTNDLLKRMRSLLPQLSKGQRHSAEYITEHYEKAAYMTAAKLGVLVGVSESTVVRFAIELGYEGYPELQRAIQDMMCKKLTAVQRIQLTNDRLGDSDILEKMLLSDIQKIKNTLDSADRTSFARAVDTIISSHTVYIAGVRSSSVLANFLAYNLNLIFDNIKLIDATSESELFEQIMRIGEKDVLVAITFPRYSGRIIKAVNFAANAKSKIIALTDSETSPISEYADILLCAKSDMASFVDSLVAPLCIINALIVAISQKKQTELADIFNRLERIWDECDVYEKDSGS